MARRRPRRRDPNGANGRKKTTAAKPAKVASKTTAKPKRLWRGRRPPPAKPAAKTKSTTKARATSR